jgi:hypothetical protein
MQSIELQMFIPHLDFRRSSAGGAVSFIHT